MFQIHSFRNLVHFNSCRVPASYDLGQISVNRHHSSWYLHRKAYLFELWATFPLNWSRAFNGLSARHTRSVSLSHEYLNNLLLADSFRPGSLQQLCPGLDLSTKHSCAPSLVLVPSLTPSSSASPSLISAARGRDSCWASDRILTAASLYDIWSPDFSGYPSEPVFRRKSRIR